MIWSLSWCLFVSITWVLFIGTAMLLWLLILESAFILIMNWCLISNFCLLLSCRDQLENYTSDYTIQVLVGYCMVYIFMQTFMIPGTIFMSLLAGALFGVLKGVALVVFAATAGASSCYFLSKLIGRPLVFSLWPDKLNFFQAQVNMGYLLQWYASNYSSLFQACMNLEP